VRIIEAVNSLAGRLLLASSLLLPLFLGMTGLYLDRSHRLSIEAAESERLQLLILTLLAEAEYDGELWLPEQLLEARFNQVDSGLYSLIIDAQGNILWSSPSALTLDHSGLSTGLPKLAVGGREFIRLDGLFHYSYQVVWETQGGAEMPLMFVVRESVAPADAQLTLYRRSLMIWLGGAALGLILCQALILYWGLRPLRKLAGDITGLESGASEGLDGAYPREVQAVTESLNTLLQSEKKRRERARNTLSDLAHSLKTPLAVIRGADVREHNYLQLIAEQVEQMEQIVAYQLQRAVGGSHSLLQMVPVAPVLERLRASLLKVYADKAVTIELEAHANCAFRGDERDLLELMGILLDNACKYGRERVRVVATGGDAQPLTISVEDDGEGIPASLRHSILQRGVRADSQHSGHGIGLAVAVDLVDSYLGTLHLAESPFGGAAISVEFPG
jgi:two-component system sensor histidine kinase PhoQ